MFKGLECTCTGKCTLAFKVARYLDQRTRGFIDMFISISSESTTEEGWTQVDGDGAEPDHEQPKRHALRVVLHQLQRLHVSLLQVAGHYWSSVENCGQQINLDNNIEI